jgi:amino acid transporter
MTQSGHYAAAPWMRPAVLQCRWGIGGIAVTNVTATGTESASGSIEQFGYRQELKRSLSLFDLIVYGFVFITPGAPILTFGIIYNLSGGLVPLVYVIVVAAMLLTALSYGQMSRIYPIAGSVYSYAGRTLGELPGFLAGWAILLDYILFPTLNYVAIAIAVHAMAPDIPQPFSIIVALTINTIVGLSGIETTMRTSLICLMAVVTILTIFFIFAGMAIMNGAGGAHLSAAPFFDAQKFSPGIMFGSLAIGVSSFLGFDAISTLAEETRGGVTAVGRGMLIVVTLVGILFIFEMYIACLFVLGLSSFPPGSATFEAYFNISGTVGGPWLKFLFAVVASLFACLPSALAGQVATARVIFSRARDGKLPRTLAHVSEKRKVPDRALLVVSGVTLVAGLTLVTDLDFLVSIISFGALLGYLLVHASVIVHQVRRRSERYWWKHLFVPSLGFIFIAYIFVTISTNALFAGLSWLAVGAVAYTIRKLRPPGRTAVIQLPENT